MKHVIYGPVMRHLYMTSCLEIVGGYSVAFFLVPAVKTAKCLYRLQHPLVGLYVGLL
jgi:hypothetical protein